MEVRTGVAGGFTQNNDRERVLDATDIVRLVGEFVALKPRGREFVGLCPFHDDHKPSMCVVPHKQIYHCFSCGAGGNAIDFVINFHKMEFLEALRFLADRAGVELTPARRAAEAPAGEPAHAGRSELAQANRFALDFFRAVLRHESHGAAARAMIEKRGISPAIAEAFEIGAAPDRWDGLLRTAEARGVSPALLREAGLLKAREAGGGFYDTFRNRLIFPIHDQLGRPIAFGGRRLNEEEDPKYLNSPETRLFEKGATLFALHRAQKAIQQKRQAIVCEGYVDAIACHQAGFTNVVATLGTALTPRHAAVLQRLCDSIVLLFDSDEAGMRAADRAIEVFFTSPVDVKIAALPDGLDPDELFARPGGADEFDAIVESATDALEYRFLRLAERTASQGASARVRAMEEEIARLVELGIDALSPMRRQLAVRRIAKIAGVSEEAVTRTLEGAAGSHRPGRAASAAPAPGSGAAPVPAAMRLSSVETAIGCLLSCPGLLDGLTDEEAAAIEAGLAGAPEGAYPAAPSGGAGGALEALWKKIATGGAGDAASLAQWLAGLEDGESRRVATQLSQRVERETDGDAERMSRTFKDCVRRLALERDRAHKADDSLDALRRLQRRHATIGGDLRTFPRASSGAGAAGGL